MAFNRGEIGKLKPRIMPESENGNAGQF